MCLIAARLLRFTPAAPALQAFSAIPLLLGAAAHMRSGERRALWLALPVAGGALYAADAAAEHHWREALREATAAELSSSCPELPAGVVEELRQCPGEEFETNRLRLQAEWPGKGAAGTTRWRVEVGAQRSVRIQPWKVTSLRLSRALGQEAVEAVPPPQTRHWDPRAQHLTWHTVWQR